MKLLDLTLPTLAENLALDEALLEFALADAQQPAVLRLWELPTNAVVMGRGTRRDIEVNDAACKLLGVEVNRRVSGGASIVAGPGCLMYSVVLRSDARQELAAVDGIHRYVLLRMTDALRSLQDGVEVAGTSDLAIRGDDGVLRKFSGNSLRIRKGAILYHGTLLYDFELSIVAQCLHSPPRQPDYRESRAHASFVTNLRIAREQLVIAIARRWQANSPLEKWPEQCVARLVDERYATTQWGL